MPVAFPDILPVGTIVDSMLTEAQFQAETSSGWILADGRSVVGSRYAAISGASTAPDCRGLFRRAKNNSRSDGNEDPDGEVALGTYKADQNLAHTHTISVLQPGGSDNHGAGTDDSTEGTYATSSNGGADARPRNIIVNTFIRIN